MIYQLSIHIRSLFTLTHVCDALCNSSRAESLIHVYLWSALCPRRPLLTACSARPGPSAAHASLCIFRAIRPYVSYLRTTASAGMRGRRTMVVAATQTRSPHKSSTARICACFPCPSGTYPLVVARTDPCGHAYSRPSTSSQRPARSGLRQRGLPVLICRGAARRQWGGGAGAGKWTVDSSPLFPVLSMSQPVSRRSEGLKVRTLDNCEMSSWSVAEQSASNM